MPHFLIKSIDIGEKIDNILPYFRHFSPDWGLFACINIL